LQYLLAGRGHFPDLAEHAVSSFSSGFSTEFACCPGEDKLQAARPQIQAGFRTQIAAPIARSGDCDFSSLAEKLNPTARFSFARARFHYRARRPSVQWRRRT